MHFQHFHRFYEVFILLDEEVGHFIEGEYWPVQEYDMVLIKPMVLHRNVYPKGPPRRRLVINFSLPSTGAGGSSGLDELHAKALSVFNVEVPVFRFPEESRSRLFGILNDIFNVKMQHHSMPELLIHSKFMEFLSTFRDVQEQNLYIQEPAPNTITQKIYSLTGYIHAHYGEELSLEALAKRIYVSPCYLSHQFKQVTGVTLVNYIQMIRARNAQQLLLNTELPISVITEQCGFTSFSQFNRIFHRFCQNSPSRFRAEGSQMQFPASFPQLMDAEKALL
jgi:AraC-like DNA-binding protein